MLAMKAVLFGVVLLVSGLFSSNVSGQCDYVLVDDAVVNVYMNGEYQMTILQCDNHYTWLQVYPSTTNFMIYVGGTWYIGPKLNDLCEIVPQARAGGYYSYPYDIPIGNWSEYNTTSEVWQSSLNMSVYCKSETTVYSTTFGTTGLCNGVSVSGAKYFIMINGEYPVTEVMCDSSPGKNTWGQNGDVEDPNFIYYMSDVNYWYIGTKMCKETVLARANGSYLFPYDAPADSWEEMNSNGDWESNPEFSVSCSPSPSTTTITTLTTAESTDKCSYVSVYGTKYFHVIDGKYPVTELLCASSPGRFTWGQTNIEDPNFVYYLSDTAFWNIGTKICGDTGVIARASGSSYENPFDVPAGSWEELNSNGDWEANQDLFVVCGDPLSSNSSTTTTQPTSTTLGYCSEVTVTGAQWYVTNGIYPITSFYCAESPGFNIWGQAYTSEPNFVYSYYGYWYIGLTICDIAVVAKSTVTGYGFPYDVPAGSWQEFYSGAWHSSPNMNIYCSK